MVVQRGTRATKEHLCFRDKKWHFLEFLEHLVVDIPFLCAAVVLVSIRKAEIAHRHADSFPFRSLKAEGKLEKLTNYEENRIRGLVQHNS